MSAPHEHIFIITLPLVSEVIPDHIPSCVRLLDCWWLTVVFTLSTRPQNCNADYLRYQFNSEDWLHATATTLLRNMMTTKLDRLLDYHVRGAMVKTYHKLDK